MEAKDKVIYSNFWSQWILFLDKLLQHPLHKLRTLKVCMSRVEVWKGTDYRFFQYHNFYPNINAIWQLKGVKNISMGYSHHLPLWKCAECLCEVGMNILNCWSMCIAIRSNLFWMSLRCIILGCLSLNTGT